MGAYAELVWSWLSGADGAPPLPTHDGWVLVSANGLSPADAERLYPAPPRLLILSGGESEPRLRRVRSAQVLAGPPPRLDEEALRELRRGYSCAVLLDGIEATSGRVLLELAHHGVQRVAFRRNGDWVVRTPRQIVLRKPLRRIESAWSRSGVARWFRTRVQRARAHDALRQRNAQSFRGERHWLEHLQRQTPRVPERSADGKLNVLLYIGQLNSGGAERQLVNLAKGLRAEGHAVRVLTTYPMADENAHYCTDLRRADVDHHVAGSHASPTAELALRRLNLHPEVVGSLPEVIRNPVIDLAGELLADPPDVLHCWLDYPNIVGAAACALSGTPHAILSTRNLNPTYFPAFYQSWMDEWYAFLTTLPQVHLLANSNPGADDYANWLRVARDRFEVIYNGVDLASMERAGESEARRVRHELGLRADQPFVVGVFRLAAEKRPQVFLDVIERVRRACPELVVAMVGVGELRSEVEASIARRGLGKCVRLLGQRKDVPALLAAADVKLLTSFVEGTPNVILEAQWAGCPPVATAAGGTPDALEHGVSGFLHPVDDVDALAKSVLRLLGDRELRAGMARAGQRFVRERFALERMLDDTLAYYETLLARPRAPHTEPRAETSEPEMLSAP
ncbi:MAG: hypothetical protein DHS20C15_16420 [Planctomycetota bacterium]|nr:MAG: hypothetical protein DHS20C15_16420 [Planctomycetota bacterium]